MITYHAYEVKIPLLPRRKISAWIKQVAEKYHKRVGEVAYIFCSDKKIFELNTEYLFHDYFTDVITFDYSTNELISGDIFISTETVRSNAEKYKVKFDEELYRVIIHGVLHLCGVKDKTKEEKKEMRIHENEALKYSIINPEKE
jgi:rRNA maturation RNase YbeY